MGIVSRGRAVLDLDVYFRKQKKALEEGELFNKTSCLTLTFIYRHGVRFIRSF